MSTENVESERSEGKGKKPHQFDIFIDAVKYSVTQASMTGAEIKALAGKDAQYQLYLEERGDHPDKLIGDNEAVAIREDQHFYAIPPATFGFHGA